jgi:hypothetical protein
MAKYYMTQPELTPAVARHAFNVDRTATLHYYGTLELPDDFEVGSGENDGLFWWDEEWAANEAEASRLYRAENPEQF